MKILILTHSYPDARVRWRGIFVKEQALALAENHDVTVVYFRVDYSSFGPFRKYSFERREDGRLTEYELTVCRSFPVITQVKYLLDTYRFIRKELFLRGNRPDIIHCHLSYPAGFLGTLLQWRTGIPSVLTEHSWIEKHFRSSVHRLLVIRAVRKSAAVIAVSEALARDIKRFVNREVKVVPNVTDVTKFPPCNRIRGERLNIGLLGGMSNYRKGADILIRAAALCRNTDAVFHIGGGGSLLPEFRALAEENGTAGRFVFHGEILGEDIYRFFCSLDIFVLASRDETFGVVLTEAMACGIPVIATRCGGPEEIVSPECGLLVPKEDPQALAEAIDTMIKDIDSWDRNAISSYAASRYGRKAFNERMFILYRELLSRSAK